MAEPSTVAAVVVPSALGITAATLIPGVDVNAVIGAVAGALFFVAWARDLGVLVAAELQARYQRGAAQLVAAKRAGDRQRLAAVHQAAQAHARRGTELRRVKT